MKLDAKAQRVPALGAVAFEQLAFLSTALGRSLLIWAVIGGFAAVPFVLTNQLRFGRGVAAFIIFFLSMGIAASAWVQRGKAPLSARSYFMSVPVRRGAHSLLRTACGWLMLMTAGAILLAFAYTRVGDDGIPLHGWVAPLIGTTTFYLVMSGLYAGTRQPIFWVMGLFLIPALVSRLASPSAEPMLDAVAEGRFGVAGLFLAAAVTEGPNGAEIMVPIDVATWLLTSGIWLAGSLAVLLFGTMRHREV